MRILIASSEIYPFAKTGGLADVTGALPKFLQKKGHKVSLVMPYYKTVKDNWTKTRLIKEGIPIPFSKKFENINLLKSTLDDGVEIYFIDHPYFFDRPHLYGEKNEAYFDNAERFILFSRSIMEICKIENLAPDIIHANDWHTALLPVYLKTLYKDDPQFINTGSLITIHNLAYQGVFEKAKLHLTGLGWELFTFLGLEFYDYLNFLKGGIIYSDIVTTVSLTYSKEIQTVKFAEKLEGVLKDRSKDLFGVLNGIDTDVWNPKKDKLIAKKYSIEDLRGKSECKKDLLNIFNLSEKGLKPVIGMVSRLTIQKGFDIVIEAADLIIEMGFKIVVLGVGDKLYEEKFNVLKDKYPNDVGVMLTFNNEIAHKIEAGSDLFLMPSNYEPCGLNQMYSLQYGTIPVVKAVGGLNDTVTNFIKKSGKGNGFKFINHTSSDLIKTLKKALNIYNDKTQWKKIIRNAMGEDNSWETSAKRYENLYKKAIKKKKKRG